jgi:hypothetical protein
MADWEFWGNPKVWKVIGIGFLLMVFGFAMWAMGVGIAIAGIPIFIGVLVVGISIYYLAYWENWLLLRKEKGV